ncbi:N-acetylglucosamine-6-phosphate deacetylase [Pseudochelatococcus lubricantis]|uniref:N-acetylglucosamine-6-phosphate deacetylase n=1 Tax=Pseudochelatococcus lubricantis TaxID=1538102 RepID=UPI0035EEA1D4
MTPAPAPPYALTGARIFSDNRVWLDDHAVVVADGRIAAITANAALGDALPRRQIDGLLVPGFVDVQVNGGGGVLFNDTPTWEGIAAIGAAHRCYGTTGFLPTLITDTPARMRAALAAVHEAVHRRVPGLLGVHLEGPFLNAARKGIHDPALIRPITDDDIRLIGDFARSLPAGFATLVTLAPECVPLDSIERLAEAGVVLSAGHTAADAATVARARAGGLTGFTHLFNAMPPLAGREPGPVGAALTDPESCCGIIVDLHHVSPVSLKAAIRAHGSARMMLVTDAMPTVGSSGNTFTLAGRTITRADGRLTAQDGTLAGSDLDMASAVRNTVAHLDVSLPETLRMASLYPAVFLRLDKEIGGIAPGRRANLVALDENLAVTATWIDGEGIDHADASSSWSQ